MGKSKEVNKPKITNPIQTEKINVEKPIFDYSILLDYLTSLLCENYWECSKEAKFNFSNEFKKKFIKTKINEIKKELEIKKAWVEETNIRFLIYYTINELEKKIVFYEFEKDKKDKKILKQEAEKIVLNDEKNKLEKEKVNLNEKLMKLDESITKNNSEQEKLQKNITMIDNSIQKIVSLQKTTSESIISLKHQIEQIENQIHQLKKNQNLKINIEELKKDISKTEKNYKNNQMLFNRLEAKKEEYKAVLLKAKVEINTDFFINYKYQEKNISIFEEGYNRLAAF